MEAVALVRLALGIITDRLITILALLASSVMCGWTMWNPMWESGNSSNICSIQLPYSQCKREETK